VRGQGGHAMWWKVAAPNVWLLLLTYNTVLGQKDSSDAHFTPKVAHFATLPLATIFIRIHKNFAVY